MSLDPLSLSVTHIFLLSPEITTPWKDLEARTMPLRKLNISQPVQSHRPYPAELTSPAHSPVNSPAREPSRNPDINTIIPSSPPVYTATKLSSPSQVNSAMVSGSAQQLPRSIIPPSSSSGMSNQDDYDETSNAVKRSLATEGLLSLMRQQES